MNIQKISIGLIIALFVPTTNAEQNPFELEPIRTFRVQAEFFEVDHKDLIQLLLKPALVPDDTAMRESVVKLVGEKKARIIETMVCTSLEGDTAMTESIEELIYPTEYEPPEIGPAEENPIAPKDQKDSNKLVNAVGPNPTAFETRNTGATMEIACSYLKEQKLIDVILAPEIVYHVKDTVWAEWQDRHGDSSVRVPLFYKLSLNTRLKLIPGKSLMAAVLSPKNDEGVPVKDRKVMVFIRADMLTSE